MRPDLNSRPWSNPALPLSSVTWCSAVSFPRGAGASSVPAVWHSGSQSGVRHDVPRGFLPSSRRRALPPSTHPTPSCVTSRPLVNRPLVGKSGRGCSCSERGRGSDRNWGQCVSNVHRPHDCQCHGHSRTRPGHCSADRPTELQTFITFHNFLTFLYWQVKVGGWHLLRWNETKIVITQPKRINSIKCCAICQSCGHAVQNMKQWIQALAFFAGGQSCVSGRGQLKWNINRNITIF